MAFEAVTGYDAAWKVSDESGEIRLEVEGKSWKTLPTVSGSEFIAVVTLLQSERSVFVDEHGRVVTHPRARARTRL